MVGEVKSLFITFRDTKKWSYVLIKKKGLKDKKKYFFLKFGIKKVLQKKQIVISVTTVTVRL